MISKELKGLEEISQAVGANIAYVQGGGGNTSVKLDGNLMAVKASGFQLKQVTQTEGYVIVDYQKIRQYYNNVDLYSDTDFEKESKDFVNNSVVETEGLKKLRPSVEAGFHSLLKKYVIHSHSVYANIITCSKNGKDLMDRIFSSKPWGVIWVPYINPGFTLTLKIKEEMTRFFKKNGSFPDAVFMENHGLIVNSDDSAECIKLHEDVNLAVREFLGIDEAYPQIRIEGDGDAFTSRTEYITGFFRNSGIGLEFFDQVLCPDQLVYLGGNISVNKVDGKVCINTVTGEVIYRTGFAEALTMEETLLAFLYVVNKVREKRFDLKTMSPREIDFIRNWESEAYRRKLVSELKKR